MSTQTAIQESDVLGIMGRKTRIVLLDGSAVEAPIIRCTPNYVVVEMAMGGHEFGIRFSEMLSVEEIA